MFSYFISNFETHVRYVLIFIFYIFTFIFSHDIKFWGTCQICAHFYSFIFLYFLSLLYFYVKFWGICQTSVNFYIFICVDFLVLYVYISIFLYSSIKFWWTCQICGTFYIFIFVLFIILYFYLFMSNFEGHVRDVLMFILLRASVFLCLYLHISIKFWGTCQICVNFYIFIFYIKFWGTCQICVKFYGFIFLHWYISRFYIL
jgi:hypothetical protein